MSNIMEDNINFQLKQLFGHIGLHFMQPNWVKVKN